METPLFLIVLGILFTFIILLRPFFGFMLMILYISMAVFPTVFPSFFGVFTKFTVIKLIGGLTFGSVLIHNIGAKKKLGLFQSTQAKFFLVYLLWVAVSGFSQSGAFTRLAFTRYISFAMLFYITISLVNTPERFRAVLWGCIVTMLLGSCFALFQHFSAEGTVRAKSTFIDSNYFNLYLLPVIPVAFYRIADEHSFIKKFIAVIATIVLILAVVFTFSRGGIIGLIVVLFLLSLNSKRKIQAFLILGIFAALFVINMPDYLRERVEATQVELAGQNPATSTYRRLLMAEGGWRMFLDYPITGVGVGNFFYTISKYVHIIPGLAHNMYIEVLAELGLVGMFLFMGIILLTLKDLRRIIETADGNLKNYAQGIYIGLLGFLVSAVFLHAEYEKFLWLFIFLTMCLKKLAAEKEGVAT